MAKPPSFFFSCSFALGFGQTTPMGYRGGSATPRPVKGATISFFFFFFIFLKAFKIFKFYYLKFFNIFLMQKTCVNT
jgi:hypothetical protein